MGFFSRRIRAFRSRGIRVRERVAAAARLRIVGWLLIACVCLATKTTASAANKFARLDYNVYTGSIFRHTIFFELFEDRPATTANFLAYVNANQYDGAIMHRLSDNFVLQGGGFYPSIIDEPTLSFPYSLNPNAVVDLDGNGATPNPTITNEPGRSNLRGTVAMAKIGGNPNSASNQWFINLSDSNTFLNSSNGGFTVFAQVAGDGPAFVDSLIEHIIIYNMNPDFNNDGTRDPGYPFYNDDPMVPANSDGTPLYYNEATDSVNVVQIINADEIDYYGSGVTTVPAGGLQVSARNAFIDAGITFNGASAGVIVAQGRTLGIRESVSLGRGITSDGIVAPGLQIGNVTVPSYLQFGTGTLEIELAGPAVGTQYDRLTVTGSALVAGKLDVSFVDGYSPGVNSSFTVLTASSITGVFSTFDLPQLSLGLVWSVSKTATAYILTVAAGDYNRNGVVDAADYLVWRRTRNTSVTANTGADGSGNGFVDDSDYLIWRNNFGNVRGTASGAGSGSLAASGVPEPGSAFLMLCGGLMFGAYRGRRAEPSRRKTA